MTSTPVNYKRVLLKLSGEALTGADYIELSALLYLEFSVSTVAEFREYRIDRAD